MKDKTIAAILAFFGGIVGLHRFYLGQRGWGIANVFFFALAISSGDATFFVLLSTLAAVFGVIDAISFLSMEEGDFHRKYNTPPTQQKSSRQRNWQKNTEAVMNDRERRFQQRQKERAERERQRERNDKLRNGQRVNPAESTGNRVRRPSSGTAEREAGVRYFKDFEYDRAIKAFQKALEKNPRDVASHFNIACSYSCEEEADLAFYHLDRAVALGFDDFGRIRNHDNLAFLRIQPRYLAFEKSNFRLTADRTAEEFDLESPVSEADTVTPLPPVHDELLEQLQRLANLREKGLLTEGEFTAQKRRLLG